MPSLATKTRYPFSDRVRAINVRSAGSSSTTSRVCMKATSREEALRYCSAGSLARVGRLT